MSEFPSSLERTVASALLLLSTEQFSSPSRSGSEDKLSLVSETYGQDGLSLSLVSTGSRSRGSSLSSDGSSRNINDHDLKINSMESPYHLLKLKTVRKRRSKVFWSSLNLKAATGLMNPVLDISTGSDDSKEELCLSSCSSEASSIESRFKIINQQRKNETASRDPKKKNSCRSNSIRRRAEAILEFLSASCSSEVKIRHVLGDSPDTSKALRMLLKMEEVKRSGTGGRLDPYIYTIALRN